MTSCLKTNNPVKLLLEKCERKIQSENITEEREAKFLFLLQIKMR